MNLAIMKSVRREIRKSAEDLRFPCMVVWYSKPNEQTDYEHGCRPVPAPKADSAASTGQ